MATKHWVGGAVPIRDLWTISVGGTWSIGDTFWAEVNGKRITITISSGSPDADSVATAMKEAINGESQSGVGNSPDATGDDIGEFNLLEAFNIATDDVWIYGPEDGRPAGTITVGETSATGTFTIAHTTTGTSRYHWDNADNWSDGSVPGGTDTLIFDYRAANSCLFELSQSLSLTLIRVEPNFPFALGLPAINTDNAQLPFEEFLTTHLTLTAVTDMIIDASAAQSIKVDTGSAACTAVVYSTGASDDQFLPPVLLKMNNAASVLHVNGGDVGLCAEPEDSGLVVAVTVSGEFGATLQIGSISTITTLEMTSGVVTSETPVTSMYISGGIMNHRTGALANLYLNGGVFNWYAEETITSLKVTDGVFDASVDSRDKTVTATHVFASATFRDPLGNVNWNDAFNVYGKIEDLELEFPASQTWKLADI